MPQSLTHDRSDVRGLSLGLLTAFPCFVSDTITGRHGALLLAMQAFQKPLPKVSFTMRKKRDMKMMAR